MAENGNGANNEALPQLNVLAQYTKDLSFENPNAPKSLGPQEQGPNINIQVNVNARQLSEGEFEVNLVLEGSAQGADAVLFKFELDYAGVFRVRNIPAALYKAMGGFATNGVNMTKLESYQKGASFSATMFFADIIGKPGEPAVDRAIEELAFHCKELRLLGSYPLERARG